ncbi:MAG TPA: hypothetical protein PK110_04375 [Niabella sp.]|nr:hypothetical protein [Chitinophagaceae bacterium]HRN48169.1 hypothetical protein [Niabella sp.]HRO84038.1 hypothetical protein [Niabella sp.]
MKFLSLNLLAILVFSFAGIAAVPDSVFLQPASEKSTFHPSLNSPVAKKIVVDFNDVVYVLTDKGVCRVFENQVIKDLRFRPLQEKVPLDIAVQEGTGYLYYLYDNLLLTNEYAGTVSYSIPADTYHSFQVSKKGYALLMGEHKFSIIENGKWIDISIPEEKISEIYVNENDFYALSKNAVYILKDRKFFPLHKGKNMQSLAFKGNDIIIGTVGGYYAINKTNGNPVFNLKTKIPIQDIRFLTSSNNQIWAGTPNGAFMERKDGKFDYYASLRWLLDDQIIGMTKGNHNDLYFLSVKGVSKISYKPYTFFGKADYFQDKIRRRHIRYGLLAEIRLKTPGDLTTAEMIDTDNDGLWSSFYIGSQAFRYAVTKEEIAKKHAWETFEAYERLVSINPLEGFPSRTYERTGFKVSDPKAWRTGKDTAWEWKGTTSSDEFVGHIFAAAVMDQFIAKTKEEKKRVANFVDTILTHIIKNNYNFVDQDGKPTLWGRWHPDYINSYAKTISDRKLGATHLIAGLQLAYKLTGKAIFKNEALRLMKEHGYLENILISPFNIKATEGYFYEGIDMGMGPWNHSDDEMEFLSYWVLYHYAFDINLQKLYGKAIKDFWQIELPEKNPVWNLITFGTEGSFDKESTLWYLREFPIDQIRWDFKNSIRKDLDFLEPNFRQQSTKEVLSPRERAAHRYNANEFSLDGGYSGREELSGAEYLLPYWMARYLKVI